MDLANKKLKFVVNGEEVNIEAIKSEIFEEAWNRECRYCPSEPEIDKFYFDYVIAVGYAISEFLGYRVHANHKSGNIAFSALKNGMYVGSFTVYSDYISIHSIDNNNYHKNLKYIA